MKIECTKKEWGLISSLLMREYNTSTDYFTDTFKTEVSYENEVVLTIFGELEES